MNIEDLIAKESKEEAKSQAKKMIINNDINMLEPLLDQLNSYDVDTSIFINSNDNKDIFIKKEIIYTLRIIIYYLYELYDYDTIHIKMSRPNLRGAIYDRLSLLRNLMNDFTYKDSNVINAWQKFKSIKIDLRNRKSQNNLKIHIKRFLTEIHK